MTTKANERQVGGDHYKKLVIQPWDYITANGIGYLEGCAIKYISRWRDKGGIKDIDKAIHFLEKLKDVYYLQEEEAKIMSDFGWKKGPDFIVNDDGFPVPRKTP